MRKVGLLLCVSAIALALVGPASAQYPGTTSTTAATTVAPAVLGQSISRPVAEVQPAVAQQDTGGLLPRTGAAILGWTVAGALLLGGGTALVVAGRRRRDRAPAGQ